MVELQMSIPLDKDGFVEMECDYCKNRFMLHDRLLFVVYDLVFIRDENEFRRDIENAGESIKVLIIKH